MLHGRSTLLTVALCLLGLPASAQSSLDPDEAELDPSEASLDEEEGDFETAREPRASDASWFDAVWRAKRVTLSHEAGLRLGDSIGFVANRSAVRLEWNQSLGSWLAAGFDGKLFLFSPGDHRAEVDGGELRAFFNLREANLQLSLGATSIKLGQQVVVWGESEAGAITDILSPRDYTEFLYPTLEDSRLGVPALRVDQYTGIGAFSVVVIPWRVGDRMQEPGSAYDVGSMGPPAVVVEDTERSLDDTEAGLRWRESIGKADLSLMAASVLDNQATLVRVLNEAGPPSFYRRHRRFTMTGLAMAYAVGNALWKLEAAYEWNRAQPTRTWTLRRRDGAKLSVGVETTAVDTTLIAIEAGVTHTFNWNESLVAPRPTEPFGALMVMRTFLHETMTAQLLVISMPVDGTFVLKLFVIYDVSDAVRIVADGGALLLGERSRFAALRDEHRANLRLEYRF